MSKLIELQKRCYRERYAKIMRSFYQMRPDEMSMYDDRLLAKFKKTRSYNVLRSLTELHT